MTDKFPQIMTVSTGVAGAAADYVTATINMPRADSATRGGRRSVYELISVDWYPGIEDIGDTGNNKVAYLSTTLQRESSDTVTLATIAADVANPTVIAPIVTDKITTTSGGILTVYPIHVDLTDEAGNGILVATDRMFITGGDINGSTAAQYVAKIKYRIVSVPGLEFVGIIQSQISGT